jgi:hypothetical protein
LNKRLPGLLGWLRGVVLGGGKNVPSSEVSEGAAWEFVEGVMRDIYNLIM